MPERTRILIVDDSLPLLETLAELMEDAGFEVSQAQDGRAALEGAGRQPPDLVLSDIRMPGMNGVELARRLEQMLPGLPIFLMTAYSDPEVRKEAEAGGWVLLDKPLDIPRLLEAIRERLEAPSLLPA